MAAQVGPARPTLRCVREDLATDWDDVAQQRAILERVTVNCRMSELDHPVVRHATATWPVGTSLTARESISGLSDPPFWKLKTGRWRGAVYVDPATGQAWLVAAGLRRAGDDSDFYATFMAQVQSGGIEVLLPSSDDLDLLSAEQVSEELAAWEAAVHETSVTAFEGAAATGTSTFDLAGLTEDDPSLATVTVEVVNVGEEPEDGVTEVVLSIRCRDWSRQELFRHAEILVLAALMPNEQAWDASHTGDASVFSFMVSRDEFKAVLTAALRRDRPPGAVEAGREAHWTHRGRLVEKAVAGEATQALCGTWFVPRQDPVPLPECERCGAVQDALRRFERG